MKKIAIIIRCFAMLWVVVILWFVAVGVQLFERKERPPRAVGFNGAETIYEDATGKLFTLGPGNRCIPVGNK